MNVNQDPIKNWFAIYTKSRAEKKVLAELTLKGIDAFLPLQKQLRQWKDRKKWVESPLLPGYCFVHVNRAEYDSVLKTKNVVCYVTFEGKAAEIQEDQINALKRMLQQNDFEVEVSFNNFEVGKKVEIIEGPLMGLQGELVEIRGRNKLLLRIDQIDKTFSIEIPSNYLSAVQ